MSLLTPKSIVRQGITLIELMVTVAIIGILVGLALIAVHQARESANRVACANNLRQLGLALTMFHTDNGAYPIDDDYGMTNNGTPLTVYTQLLPYVEQLANSPAAPQAVKSFLCPSRRTPSVGPRDDYAGALPLNFWIEDNPSWVDKDCVLQGVFFVTAENQVVVDVARARVTMDLISDGLSNTLLLSHKAMQPRYYAGGSPPISSITGGTSDSDWAGASDRSGYEHKREPSKNHICDVNSDQDHVEALFGSPHPNAMPGLFCDGSVRQLRYQGSAGVALLLWCYNDGQTPIDW